MFTFDEVASYLDDIVDELPEEITKGLNGGVYLLPEAKPHPVLPFPRYMIMGEYIYNPVTGPRINVYYNSVMGKYVDASEEDMKRALKEIVCHEFRHHLEKRAGVRDLEEEDKRFVRREMGRTTSPKGWLGKRHKYDTF